MKIVVLLPTLNEENTIGSVIDGIKETVDCRIIVVDDASTDSTRKVVLSKKVKLISLKEQVSLSKVFSRGLKEALKLKPDIIVHIDADGQYSPREIPKLIEPIKNSQADLVLGSRFSGKIEKMSFVKYVGNLFFSALVSLILGEKISDAQTGFRAFTYDLAKNLRISSNYTYTQEMVIRAKRGGYRIKEVPVFFARRRYGESRLINNPLKYGIRALLDIFRANSQN